ncbi:ComF family protein [Alkalibacillus sp. S2W]|uniref:ComF family protein n=1 Tax=Alkalibacillus sp. S2W TaxID=3386553 RepID=UPI00398CC45A
MNCYICQNSTESDTTWATLLVTKSRLICDDCEQLLPLISGPTCPICMKPTHGAKKCPDCYKWSKHFTKDPLKRNISLYRYTPEMKAIMSRFKYRGDYEIIHAFESAIQSTYKTHFSDQPTIIPIPLHPSRQQQRLFNQAEAIAQKLNQPYHTNILDRQDNSKQSKKSRYERITSLNPFTITQNPPNKILLIDDIYTTGTTLRQAADLLIKHGAKSVESFTLIRS